MTSWTGYANALSLFIGCLLDVSGFSYDLLIRGARLYLISTLLTILLSTPVGFMASFSRGYLAPLALIVITLVLAQIVAAIGYGEYFPWSIPSLVAISIENTHMMVEGFSIWLVIFLSGLGLIGTILWWKYADQD